MRGEWTIRLEVCSLFSGLMNVLSDSPHPHFLVVMPFRLVGYGRRTVFLGAGRQSSTIPTILSVRSQLLWPVFFRTECSLQVHSGCTKSTID